MMELISILCLLIAAILLLILTIIDFKKYLLPNIYVFPFAALGVAFHSFTNFEILDLSQIAIGGIAGYGILYGIRFLGNKYYGQDSLGLGDVKLLGASGLWLGLEGVLIAMTVGAFFGLIHGFIHAVCVSVKNKTKLSIKRLKIPAGPGFIGGIIVAFFWLFHHDILRLFYSVFA
ncbi:MAG: A24 family peptidase [Pseudomonadota bacterium]